MHHVFCGRRVRFWLALMVGFRFVDPNEGVGIAIAAREKCIIFAEHPSLRMGPAVELLQLMGGDSR